MSSQLNMLSCKDLSVQIAGKQICNKLSLSFKQGEAWAILGINGSGKTTLLHTLAGLLPATSGDILIENTSLQQLSRKKVAQQLGLLMQKQEDYFPSNVMETVLIGRHPHLNQWQWESEQDKQIALDVLKQVGLTGFTHRAVQTLSGGERQRVAIATLLAQQVKIRLFDEPTNHLDVHHQHEIMKSLLKQKADYTQVFVLHDINHAAHYCDHALLLFANGEVVTGDSNVVLNVENLSRLYQHPIREITAEGKRWFISE